MDGVSIDKASLRRSPRDHDVPKDGSENTTIKNLNKSDNDNKRKLVKDDVSGKGAKGTEGTDAPAGKKKKVEEEDDAEKKKYLASLSPRHKKVTVTLGGGVTKKAHELDNAEMEEALDKHDDPKNPTPLTQSVLEVLSTSREFYKDSRGGDGKRLAQDPKKHKDNTDVKGVTRTERMVSNLRKYLTNPQNASFGADKAGVSKQRKQHAANGKGANDHNGVTAKQKLLGGSPLTKILESGHTKVKGHEVNGKHYTEVTVLSSPSDGVKASKNQNRTCLLLAEAGVSIYNKRGNTRTTGNKEVKKMKNSTTTLKTKLTDHIGMAGHPRNRKGGWPLVNDTHPGDKHPWYNMKMTFFFKGREEDVAQYQQTVETPSEDEVAMLAEKK